MKIEETMEKYLVEGKSNIKNLRRSLQMLSKEADKFVKNVKMTKGVIEIWDDIKIGNLNNNFNDMKNYIDTVLRNLGDLVDVIDSKEV